MCDWKNLTTDEKYAQLVEENGPEVAKVLLERSTDYYRNKVAAEWLAVTDHPFPDDLIASPRVRIRTDNITKVRSLLKYMKNVGLVSSDRKMYGEFLMTHLTSFLEDTKDGGDEHPLLAFEEPSYINEVEANDSEEYVSLEQFELEARPITKGSICQEKVFKKLSGDNRRILKCGRANAEESKKPYLLCTIVGFRGRECAFAEPVGTCGMYENEARFLIVDEKSTMRGCEAMSVLDLPVTRDIKVYELERVRNVESSDVTSLLVNKAMWRVKSFSLVEQTTPVCDGVVLVREVHPTEHTVLIEGSWFAEPQYIHMGSCEMPPVYSFMHGPIYSSGYQTLSVPVQGLLLSFKINEPKTTKSCRVCGGANTRNFCISRARVFMMIGDDLEMSEKEFEHQCEVGRDETICMGCTLKGPIVPANNDKKKIKMSGRKGKKNNSTPKNLPNSPLVNKLRREKCGDSGASLGSDIAEPETLASLSLQDGEYVNQQASIEVEKPDPIKCNLCLINIQPMEECYLKVCCLEDCHLFVHKKCMQDRLASQGLHKKREYKDGYCPTEGCGVRIQDIYEFSIRNEESLYLKCAEKPKVEKTITVKPKKDKKRKDKSTIKDASDVRNDVQLDEIVPADVSAQVASGSAVPAVPAEQPPKPNRSIPLPVDIDNVVPLVKEKDPLEEKYAVLEQPQKRTKAPNNKKKVVLDTGFTFPREQNKPRDEKVPVQRGGHYRNWRTAVRQESESEVDVDEQKCEICRRSIETDENSVLFCHKCDQPYHVQCDPYWFTAFCPPCRRNGECYC